MRHSFSFTPRGVRRSFPSLGSTRSWGCWGLHVVHPQLRRERGPDERAEQREDVVSSPAFDTFCPGSVGQPVSSCPPRRCGSSTQFSKCRRKPRDQAKETGVGWVDLENLSARVGVTCVRGRGGGRGRGRVRRRTAGTEARGLVVLLRCRFLRCKKQYTQ